MGSHGENMISKRKMKRQELIQTVDTLSWITQELMQKVRTLEVVLNMYVDFEGNEDEFKKYLEKNINGEHKQPKRKRSRRSTKTSK